MANKALPFPIPDRHPVLLILDAHRDNPKRDHLQRGFGLITVQKSFIDDKEINYVSILLTLKIYMLKIVMDGKTIRIDDLIEYEEFVEIMKGRYSSKYLRIPQDSPRLLGWRRSLGSGV